MFLLLPFFCLFLSGMAHLAFLKKAGEWRMPGFGPESYDTIVPRTFRMERVDIDPHILEQENQPKEKEKRNEMPIALERETPQIGDGKVASSAINLLPHPKESIPLEKPSSLDTSSGLEDLLVKVPSIKEVSDGGNMGEDPLKMPESKETETESVGRMALPGNARFSSLDELLATKGLVKQNTAPILMPTDLLFEYDSDVLKPQAAATLEKLASLIKKNKEASFQIEGHTDSFGGDEYNIQLSLRRAEAVKTWLKSIMGLDAGHISTLGLGKSRLLVPSTGTVEQQQINRRVEIVISLPK